MSKLFLVFRYFLAATCSAIPAFVFATSSSVLELDAISYEEALYLYQEQGGIENYRCTLQPADAEYRVTEHSLPIAVEIDDWLFVRLAGVIHSLPQQHIIDSEALYGSDELSAKLVVKQQFNHSEYGESDDRFVELTMINAAGEHIFRTVGAACGI